MDVDLEKKSIEEKLIALIVEKLDSGDKLPTEKQMVDQFGVSRARLREVLSVFEASGIIQSCQGSGRYVKMPDVGAQIVDTWSILLRAKPSMLLELLEIRSLLEINTLPQAMQRIDLSQLQEMNALVARMKEKAARGEDFVPEDRQFHKILFGSTGNLLLEQLLTAFWDLYELSKIETHHADLAEAARQHEEILQAFARQDLPVLTSRMKDQFQDARFRIMVNLIKPQG